MRDNNVTDENCFTKKMRRGENWDKKRFRKNERKI